MGNPRRPAKPCQMCECENSVAGEKYCRKCRMRVIANLKNEGYLDVAPRSTRIFSDERGRGGGVSTKTLGGTAELNSDGDNW